MYVTLNHLYGCFKRNQLDIGYTATPLRHVQVSSSSEVWSLLLQVVLEKLRVFKFQLLIYHWLNDTLITGLTCPWYCDEGVKMFQHALLTTHTASDSIASTLLRVTMPPEHIGLKL